MKPSCPEQVIEAEALVKAEIEKAIAPKHDRARGAVALLIIDMINCFDFPGADAIVAQADAAAEAILTLKASVEEAGYPVVYVNDNFGEWHSERSRLLNRALAGGNAVACKLKPNDEDYFIIKPQFSGFYSTNLPVLLPKLGVSRLILTGIATDICILFTAADAHMRDYSLWIPEDAVASTDHRRGAWALEIMRNSMNAETAPARALTIRDWMRRLDQEESETT